MASACKVTCPAPWAPDHDFQCSDLKHGHHDVYNEWQGHVYMHTGLQWSLFFLIMCLILGAFFRRIFPDWMPYTVGILIVFFFLGVIAGALERRAFCPHHAWAYDADGSGYIERAEYDKFTGRDTNVNSFCAVADTNGQRLEGDDPYRLCSFLGNCKAFDDLDDYFKLSSMLPTKANKHGAHDGKLSADELWTADCNLLRDMIGLSDLDPHLILTVFLPALLFESAAFGVDMGIFKKQIWQILMMAFPSMILASILTGVLIFGMFRGEWTIWVCWLIGVISSATDPVAVVALLKDLGASKTLGTIIEGESLLNDGSAVVLYSWIRNAIGYDYSTLAPGWMSADTANERYAGHVGVDFVVVVSQMLLFGALFGLLFGAFTRFLLRFVYNDRFIEGSLLIGMTYLCFWLGELITGASAVIAVVVMGLYMNVHKSALSPAVFAYMHQFYEMIAHILNTIIFAIAGAKLGTLMMNGTLLQIIQLFSWRLFMIYPIVLFTRGFCIFLFFPILKRIGTGCTWQEAVVMWWGGLRGSVGLALGLVVLHTSYDANMWGLDSHTVEGAPGDGFSLDCRDQPVVVLFMNMIVVFFTVVVNGISMAPLMRYLKMTAIPMDRRFQLNTAYLHLRRETEAKLAKLITAAEKGAKGARHYHGADWAYVYRKIVKHHELFTDVDDVKRAAWMSVLTMERASYLAQFEAGRLSAEAFLALEGFMATLVADASRAATDQLARLYDDQFHLLLKRLRETEAFESESEHKALVYAVYVAYHEAQEEVKHTMHVFAETSESSDVIQAAIQKASDGGAHLPSKFFKKKYLGGEENTADGAKTLAEIKRKALEELEKVRAEHHDNDDEMEALYEGLEQAATSASAKGQLALFKSQHALNRMLLQQRDSIEHMRHEGILTDLDAAPLNAECNAKLGALKLDPLLEKFSSSQARSDLKAALSKNFEALAESSVDMVEAVRSPSKKNAITTSTTSATSASADASADATTDKV